MSYCQEKEKKRKERREREEEKGQASSDKTNQALSGQANTSALGTVAFS